MFGKSAGAECGAGLSYRRFTSDVPLRIALLLLTACLASVPRGASAGAITFRQIADTTAGFNQFSNPSINEAGSVAFVAERPNGSSGIFSGNGGALTTIADSSGPFLPFTAIDAPSINAAGIVAFRAGLDTGGRGIFTGSGGNVSTIAFSAGTFNDFGDPSINDSGSVAFRATLNTTGASGIFVGRGGAPMTTIADSAGSFAAFGSARGPRINAAGTVAFAAGRDDFVGGIYTGTGGLIRTVADTTGSFTILFEPDQNDGGRVAFRGSRQQLGTGVFVADLDGTLHLVSPQTTQFEFLGEPEIGNDGLVAYWGELLAGGEGIFIGPDLAEDRVISTGDVLFGGTVVRVSRFLAVNNVGGVAFGYSLNNGRSGIAVAQVPEPSGVMLAGLTLSIARRRRNRRG